MNQKIHIPPRKGKADPTSILRQLKEPGGRQKQPHIPRMPLEGCPTLFIGLPHAGDEPGSDGAPGGDEDRI